MSKPVTINSDQKLYVIPCSAGFTCLGFEIAEKRRRAILAELGEPVEPVELGTIGAYDAYAAAVEKARLRHVATGWRSSSDLIPELIGLEGKRVEVVAKLGDGMEYRTKFYVGKSTGWVPCHLEIKTRASIGGEAVWWPEGATARVIGSR